MLLLCRLFCVAHKSNDLGGVSREKAAAQGQFAGRVLVIGSMARGTNVGFGVAWRDLRPLPAPVLEHGPALRTSTRLGKLAARLVGIVTMLFDVGGLGGIEGLLRGVI